MYHYQNQDDFTGLLNHASELKKKAVFPLQEKLAVHVHNIAQALKSQNWDCAGFTFARCDADIDHILPKFIRRITFNKMMKTLK